MARKLDPKRTAAFIAGWRSACERYACGESRGAIIAAPTVNAWGYTEPYIYNYMAGVHTALAFITGDVPVAHETEMARFGVRALQRRELLRLALQC